MIFIYLSHVSTIEFCCDACKKPYHILFSKHSLFALKQNFWLIFRIDLNKFSLLYFRLVYEPSYPSKNHE